MSTDHSEEVSTDDEVTLQEPTLMVRPGDLDALEAATLAAAQHWTALAALALHGDQHRRTPALEQLAAGANDPIAFTWLWSILVARPGTPDWLATRAMPQEVTVPADLLATVAAETADAPSDNPARDVARVEILKRQQTTTPGALELATGVIGAKTALPSDVGNEAARILGSSTDRKSRTALLLAAEASSPWLQGGQWLTYLQPPLDEREVEAILAAIDESRPQWSPNLISGDPLWPCVQRLVAALPVAAQLGVLNQPGLSDLLVAGPVMRSLSANGASGIGQVLELAAAERMHEPVVQAVLAELHTLPEPHAVDLAERAHQLLPPERTSVARQHYMVQAKTYRDGFLGGHERLGLPALAALARMALTEPPLPVDVLEGAALEQDMALHDYADTLRPGETSDLEVMTMNTGRLRRLGAVLGLRLRGNLPHQHEQARHHDREIDNVQAATEDTIAILHALSGDETSSGRGDAHGAEMLAGLTAIAAGLVAEPLVVAALDAGPASTALIARAAPSPTAAILGADPDRWPPSRTLDVLEAINPDAAMVLSVEKLASALDWTAVESSDNLERATSGLARHRRLLATAVSTAVNSQNGPPAQAASLARVVALVRALVDHGGEARTEPDGDTGHQEPQDVAALITVLVEEPHDELHEVAGSWLAVVTPTRALADLVIRADDAITDPSPYLPARTAMASWFCAQAQDKAWGSDARIEALRAAQDLDAGQARVSGLDLIATSAVPLRRVAAGVIATTRPSLDEGDRLTALIEVQRDQPTRKLLERARRNLVSGSLGEALTNAVDLVGAQGSFGDLDPAVCLPDARAHAAFIRCVDQARVSETESPNSRLNSMINLADLLGEQAIAAYWLQAGTDKEKEKAEKLRAGARDKEDIGFLVIQQNLVQRLGWLSQLAALRASRTAHPTPSGSTTPLELNEADALSAVPLLRRIFEGWVQQMHAANHQPLPPASR